MKFNKTYIPGLLVIEPPVFEDARGHFFESYQKEFLASGGIHDHFVQDNEALSRKGVVRGLHYQTGEFAQSKLVRVVCGKVFDVAVDIRDGSPTFGKWFGIELSGINKKQLYIPRGFAHGYMALEDNTILCYKCDNYYSKVHEGGIRFDDPTLQITWPDAGVAPILSEKDLALPVLRHHRKP